MTQNLNATYRGIGGEFTAHKGVASGTGWITGIPAGETAKRYIGGRGSYSDAIDAALDLAAGKRKP